MCVLHQASLLGALQSICYQAVGRVSMREGNAVGAVAGYLKSKSEKVGARGPLLSSADHWLCEGEDPLLMDSVCVGLMIVLLHSRSGTGEGCGGGAQHDSRSKGVSRGADGRVYTCARANAQVR